MGWLDENNIEFVNSIPNTTVSVTFDAHERLFEKKPPGTSLSRAWNQSRSVLGGYREGGFFIVIARRR